MTSTLRNGKSLPWSLSFLLLVFWGPGIALPVSGQEALEKSGPADPVQKQLREIVESYVELDLFNGVILVGRGGEVLLRGGYGYANFEHRVPNTPETRFRLASVTKQFTAAALLKLSIEQGVDLRKPATSLLPELRPELSSAITPHQLLSHSSGIPRDLERFSTKRSGDQFSRSDRMEILNGTSLEFEPGSRFSYSNAGYVLASRVIELLSGDDYGEAMRKTLFDPLGLENTGNEVTGPLLPNRASGYNRLPDGIVNAHFENKSYVTGAGSLYSTLDDLWIWCRAVLSGDVLGPKTSLLFENHQERYGYGWFLGTYPRPDGTEGKLAHHDGGCPGFGTMVALHLDDDLVVIALSNVRPTSLNSLRQRLVQAALGGKVVPPPASVENEILRIALTDGVEAAQKRHQEARERKEPGAPNSRGINRWGYRYLESNQPEKAIRLFQLYVALYPDDANAHDSLGEGYMTANRRDLAIASYRKSLELNRENGNAKVMLKKLGAPIDGEESDR